MFGIRKRIIGFTLALCMAMGVCGQVSQIRGIVVDSIDGGPLPYASVSLEDTGKGVMTDGNGNFSLSASGKDIVLEVSFLGYNTKKVKAVPGKAMNLRITLVPSDVVLNEVVIKPGREHYRRRDNPAVRFVKQVIERRESNDPRHHDYYSYDQYEKMVFAMNEFQPKEKKNGKFSFVKDFIDTLEVGTTILPVSEKERVEKVYYRHSPRSEKRLVTGSKSSGVDEVFSRDGIRQFLDEAFQEVDIFRNNIPLFLQRFVSPLSTIGPGFYKYYLLDTLEVAGQPCVDLGFVPFNSESFGFTGHLYVTLDSTYFVKRVILNVAKDINLNFVSGMTIEQTFERTPDDTRLLTKDDIRVNFKLSEKTKGMYAQRLILYSNHSFLPPSGEEARIFEASAPVITQQEAYNRKDDFWEANRPELARKKNPNSVEKLMARLRSVPVFYITEKVVTTLVSGYIPTNKDPRKNQFDLGPMNSTINGNAIEGARFRIGGGTTPVFNKHWFLEGYMAYGTRDHKLKYDGLVEYSFTPRATYRLDYPIHSLRFEYMYDINKLGQNYMYTSKDNVMLAIRRKKTRMPRICAVPSLRIPASIITASLTGWSYVIFGNMLRPTLLSTALEQTTMQLR